MGALRSIIESIRRPELTDAQAEVSTQNAHQPGVRPEVRAKKVDVYVSAANRTQPNPQSEDWYVSVSAVGKTITFPTEGL